MICGDVLWCMKKARKSAKKLKKPNLRFLSHLSLANTFRIDNNKVISILKTIKYQIKTYIG